VEPVLLDESELALMDGGEEGVLGYRYMVVDGTNCTLSGGGTRLSK
jgi:hypothetical protein